MNVGKVLGGMKTVFSCRAMGMIITRRLCEEIVSTALYGAETQSMGVEAIEFSVLGKHNLVHISLLHLFSFHSLV